MRGAATLQVHVVGRLPPSSGDPPGITITQGTQPTLDQLLSPTRMDLDQSFSSVTILSFFLGALICSMVCSAVVERAWQCLDFCGTMYFLHLISCCIYSGFPLEWEWWAANVLSLVIMVLLSEYMLVKKEQQPIEMDKMWKV
eukprot:1371658-Amorphochlora_amoeboformis.AAC.1